MMPLACYLPHVSTQRGVRCTSMHELSPVWRPVQYAPLHIVHIVIHARFMGGRGRTVGRRCRLAICRPTARKECRCGNWPSNGRHTRPRLCMRPRHPVRAVSGKVRRISAGDDHLGSRRVSKGEYRLLGAVPSGPGESDSLSRVAKLD